VYSYSGIIEADISEVGKGEERVVKDEERVEKGVKRVVMLAQM
jgi:hypothetical protein